MRFDLRPVCKRTFKLCNLAQSVFSSYVPVTFDELHYSVLHLMVHSVMLNYVFRPASLQDHESTRKVSQEEPVIRVVPVHPTATARSASAMRLGPGRGRGNDKGKTGSLAEYFFCDGRGRLPKLVSPTAADRLRQDYMSMLLTMHDKLKG